MKYCPNCGTPVEEGQKFCGECGAQLDLPPEPVYTEDDRLKNDPLLSTPVPGPAPKRTEKVPELTLEPDLWGKGAAAAAAPEQAGSAVPVPTPQAQDIAQKAEDFDYERPDAEYHGPAQGGQVHYAGPQTAQTELGSDYTMSGGGEAVPGKKLPDETLMLIWSIILTCLFSVCGIVGLVKTIKARKTTDMSMKERLLNSAKVWLIIGTALRVLPFLSELL